MVDIDHFKRVSDQHPHLVGDKVLVKLARVLGSRMRTQDVPCRWGGEEFMIARDTVQRYSAIAHPA